MARRDRDRREDGSRRRRHRPCRRRAGGVRRGGAAGRAGARATCTRGRRTSPRAIVDEVLEPSPHRVAPPCPALAAGAAGAAGSTSTPDGQLRLKATIVAEALRRTAKLARRGGRAAARCRRGRTAPRCGSPSTAGRPRRPACRVEPPCGAARRLPRRRIRRSRRCCPTLRCDGADEVSLRVGVAERRECRVAAVAVRTRRVVGSAGRRRGGRVGAVVHETVAGASLRVSAASFFQSGPACRRAAGAYRARGVRPTAREPGPVLDAYGGVGLFAATLGDGDGDPWSRARRRRAPTPG